MSLAKPQWDIEGWDWPNRALSRFVEAAGFRWHVQEAGRGPSILLLHGTGAATHSWRDVLPILAGRCRVVAVDLPGHGFTETPHDRFFHLPEMAAAVGALCAEVDLAPDLIVGHSAGAAVAIRMALDGHAAPGAIVAVNGALLPFPGAAATLFPRLARLLFLNPFAPGLFAWRARDPSATPRLLASVGSPLDAQGVSLYERLFRTPGHVDATLRMMAHWDLAAFAPDLAKLEAPLVLLVGEQDAAVPPERVMELLALAPSARAIPLPDLGHLAHEEAPERVAALILDEMSHLRQGSLDEGA